MTDQPQNNQPQVRIIRDFEGIDQPKKAEPQVEPQQETPVTETQHYQPRFKGFKIGLVAAGLLLAGYSGCQYFAAKPEEQKAQYTTQELNTTLTLILDNLKPKDYSTDTEIRIFQAFSAIAEDTPSLVDKLGPHVQDHILQGSYERVKKQLKTDAKDITDTLLQSKTAQEVGNTAKDIGESATQYSKEKGEQALHYLKDRLLGGK